MLRADSTVDGSNESHGITTITTPQPFYGPFSRTTWVSRCQKRTSGLLWCKGRLTEADTLTIRLGTTPSGLTSAHLHHPPYFLQARCPSCCCPTNSVQVLKATSEIPLKQCKEIKINKNCQTYLLGHVSVGMTSTKESSSPPITWLRY